MGTLGPTLYDELEKEEKEGKVDAFDDERRKQEILERLFDFNDETELFRHPPRPSPSAFVPFFPPKSQQMSESSAQSLQAKLQKILSPQES